MMEPFEVLVMLGDEVLLGPTVVVASTSEKAKMKAMISVAAMLSSKGLEQIESLVVLCRPFRSE